MRYELRETRTTLVSDLQSEFFMAEAAKGFVPAPERFDPAM